MGLLSVGGFVCIFLSVLLSYLLFTMLLRFFLGERILLRAELWLYLSAWLYSISLIPIFARLESLCVIICDTIVPIHAAFKIATIGFVWSRFDLLDPQRVCGSKSHPPVWVVRICCSICIIYVLHALFKTITRFWTPCYDLGEIGGCTQERNPIYFLANVPDMLLIFCEIVLLQQFVRGAKRLYLDHDFNEQNLWFETEMVSKMQRYFVTSLITVITNIILYTVVAVTGVLSFYIENGQSPAFARILAHANACNILINVCMTVSCFPLRSWSAYHLLQSISTRDLLGLPPPSDLNKKIPSPTQEQLEEFKNFERSVSERASTERNLLFGFRPIERNWVRNPYTNEKEFMTTPSESDSKKETTTSSGSMIELIIPEHYLVKE